MIIGTNTAKVVPNALEDLPPPDIEQEGTHPNKGRKLLLNFKRTEL